MCRSWNGLRHALDTPRLTRSWYFCLLFCCLSVCPLFPWTHQGYARIAICPKSKVALLERDRVNVFNLSNASGEDCGECHFPAAAFANHSCLPNVQVKIVKGHVLLIALHDIARFQVVTAQPTPTITPSAMQCTGAKGVTKVSRGRKSCTHTCRSKPGAPVPSCRTRWQERGTSPARVCVVKGTILSSLLGQHRKELEHVQVGLVC